MKLQRRTLVMAGVAAAAGGAGALVATRRFQLQPVMSEAEVAFWAGEFEGPNGQQLRQDALIREENGTLVLIGNVQMH